MKTNWYITNRFKFKQQMIWSTIGNILLGSLFLCLGLLWLSDYANRGYINTGRWGLFVPASGAHAILIIFFLVLVGVFFLVYSAYLFACLIAFSRRGDFDGLPEISDRKDIPSASVSGAFAAILTISVFITVVLFLILRIHI